MYRRKRPSRRKASSRRAAAPRRLLRAALVLPPGSARRQPSRRLPRWVEPAACSTQPPVLAPPCCTCSCALLVRSRAGRGPRTALRCRTRVAVSNAPCTPLRRRTAPANRRCTTSSAPECVRREREVPEAALRAFSHAPLAAGRDGIHTAPGALHKSRRTTPTVGSCSRRPPRGPPAAAQAGAAAVRGQPLRAFSLAVTAAGAGRSYESRRQRDVGDVNKSGDSSPQQGRSKPLPGASSSGGSALNERRLTTPSRRTVGPGRRRARQPPYPPPAAPRRILASTAQGPSHGAAGRFRERMLGRRGCAACTALPLPCHRIQVLALIGPYLAGDAEEIALNEIHLSVAFTATSQRDVGMMRQLLRCVPTCASLSCLAALKR